VLPDAGNAVAKPDGLVFTPAEAVTDTTRKLRISLDACNGDGAHTLPAATTAVVGADRAIRFAAASGDYRVGPDEALAALCASGVMRSGFNARGPSAHDCSSCSPLAKLSGGPLATQQASAGTVAVRVVCHEGVGELKRFFVTPEYRGTSVADALLDALLAYAQAHELGLVRLETGDKQRPAIGFYRRHGFVEVPRFGP
jgi:ribosomal protein S18 acetylase RimI-like enzyme